MNKKGLIQLKSVCLVATVILVAASFISTPLLGQNISQIEGSIKNTSKTTAGARDSVRKAKRAAMALQKGNTFTFHDSPLHVGIPDLDSVVDPLKGFQVFDKAYMHNDFRAHRGGIGLTDQVIGYTPTSESGFKYRNNPFSSWMYTLENTPFYQTKTPYTTLFFANNFGKKLNIFNVTHTQNVYRGLNLAIDYNVLQSIGTYTNSNAMNHNLRFYGNFFTKNARYRLQFGYIHNTAKIGENGGIKEDSLFRKNIESNRLRIPVAMESGGTRWRDNTYFVKQIYHIYNDKKDTLPENDKSYGYIAHTFELNDWKMTYKDDVIPSGGYYQHFNMSESQTRDTTTYLKMTNRLFYSSSDVEMIGKAPFKVVGGIKNEFIKRRDLLTKDSWTTWYPFAELQAVIAKQWIVDVYGDYAFGNYNNNNFSGKAYFKYCLPGKGREISKRDGVKLTVGYKENSADYMQAYHFSNHFYWNTAWEKEKELYASLEFDYKGWWLKAHAARKDGHVFYKKDGPVQAADAFYFGNITIGKDLEIGKYVGLNSLLMLAYSSDERYMHLPLFSMRETIYGRIPIKNLAEIHIGIDLFYNTSYYADGYMPALNEYYWQDEVKVGNYLIMDLFVNFQIKRVNVFIKLQNMAQGMIAYDYMDTPHNPLQDRCVRFGISWKFFD